MNRTAAVLMAAAMASIALIPLVSAVHYQPAGNPNCDPTDAVHAYGAPGGAIVDSQSLTLRRGLAATFVHDGNLQDCPAGTGTGHADYGDGIPWDYDGDTEFGVNGGRFAGGAYISDCSDYSVAHHPHGAGTEYWAVDNNPASDIFFSVGTDGPVVAHDPLDPTAWCVTNDVISGDPVTDPADCPGNLGSNGPNFGLVKSAIGGRNTPAGQNDPLSPVSASVTACDGYDGYAWFFLWSGVFEDGSNVYLSTPTSGDIFH